MDDIEAIKQLKARYCRLLDAKDWQAWRGLFTDDFESDTTASGGKAIHGADAFVAFVSEMLGRARQTTVHQVHAPEITLTSATTASGIWALEDLVKLIPGITMRGYGHYHETYLKADGEWRIRSSTLTRLRGDIVTPLFSLPMPGWGRGKGRNSGAAFHLEGTCRNAGVDPARKKGRAAAISGKGRSGR